MVEQTSLFDLVLTGQLAQGVERPNAITQLAQLFKMPTEKVEALLTSAPVVLKRDMAWEVAKRYRVAIKQAGALSDIRPAEASRPVTNQADTNPVAPSPAPGPQGKETATAGPTAQWSLAAVGADVLRPDERQEVVSRLASFTDFALRPNEGNLLDAAEMAPVVAASVQVEDNWDVLPPGSAVLAEHERALPVAALVDAPNYEIAAVGERLSQEATSAVTAPDTSHITLAKP